MAPFCLLAFWSTWMTVAAHAAVLFPVTLYIIYWAILRNLPENLQATPIHVDDVPHRVLDIVEDYERLGFLHADHAVELALFPTAVLVPLYHPGEQCFATVYILEGSAQKIGYDFITPLRVENGGVTTATDIGAGYLPLPAGCLLQILPGLRLPELFRCHRDAVRWADEQGFPAKAADPSRLLDSLRLAIARQRSEFLRNRVWNTLVALGRTVGRRSPCRGPMSQQAFARRAIAELRKRRTDGVREEEKVFG